MAEGVDTLAECHGCGLLQHLPAVPYGALAACPRCDAMIHQSARHTLPLSLACAGVGLPLFGLALWLPMANASMPGGRAVTSDLFTGPALLRETGAWELSIVVVLTLLVLPAFQLVTIVAMASERVARQGAGVGSELLRGTAGALELGDDRGVHAGRDDLARAPARVDAGRVRGRPVRPGRGRALLDRGRCRAGPPRPLESSPSDSACSRQVLGARPSSAAPAATWSSPARRAPPARAATRRCMRASRTAFIAPGHWCSRQRCWPFPPTCFR